MSRKKPNSVRACTFTLCYETLTSALLAILSGGFVDNGARTKRMRVFVMIWPYYSSFTLEASKPDSPYLRTVANGAKGIYYPIYIFSYISLELLNVAITFFWLS